MSQANSIQQQEISFAGMDSMEERFLEFDKNNPQAYKMFKKFVFDAIKKGRQHYGANGIIELIRWHTFLDTNDHDYKINNNWGAYYARKFENEYPQYKGFFRSRRLRR